MEESAAIDSPQPPQAVPSLTSIAERTASFIGELGKSESSATRRHSDEAMTTLQSVEEMTKGLKDKDHVRLQQLNLHHLAVLKKHLFLRKLHSTGSIVHLTASTTPPPAATSSDKEDQRYEEMMERFQIRRLQPAGAGEGDNANQRDFRRGSGFAIFYPQQGDSQVGAPFESRGTLPDFSERSFSRSPLKHGRLRGSLLDTRATVIDMSSAVKVPQASTEDEGSTTTMGKLEKLYHEGTSLRWVFIAWKRKFVRKYRRMLHCLKSPMSPFSLSFKLRMAVLSAALSAYMITFPVNFAFTESEREWTQAIDYGVELVFLVDFLLMFNTSFVNKRSELVTSRRGIAINYVTGWGILDVVSSIPFHFGREFVAKNHIHWNNQTIVTLDIVFFAARLVHLLSILGFLWNARLNRAGKSVWDWLLYSRYSHLLRIGAIVSFIMLIAHYMACIWKILSPSDLNLQSNSSYEIYAVSFYDALQLLQGQGVHTSTLSQNAFASLAVLVGSIVLAIIFGHVAVLVSNFNANSTNYQRKMESVFAIMTKMELPAPLRERIHQYYEHLWREYESLDGEIGRFSKDLSHTLELEVVLFKYMELIMHIPFWNECTPDFQKQLMLNLHVRVYLPDDFIIRRGEVGDEFYMINHGSCELATGSDSLERATAPLKKKNASGFTDFADFMGTPLHPTPSHGDEEEDEGGDGEDDEDESDSDSSSDDEKHRKNRAKRSIYRTENFDDDDGMNPLRSTRASKNIKKLTRGQAFGEMALLTNYQRTANVRAITYVEMCVLNRADFHRILARYPDDRKQVTLHILTNSMEKNESNRVYCPLKEAVRAVFGKESDPSKSVAITAKYAAELIARIINPDLEDDSIKFGIGTKLKQQLIEFRDRSLRKDAQQRPSARVALETLPEDPADPRTQNITNRGGSSRSSASMTQVSPALLDRIESIENTQAEVLRYINEMRGVISEMKRERLAGLNA